MYILSAFLAVFKELKGGTACVWDPFNFTDEVQRKSKGTYQPVVV